MKRFFVVLAIATVAFTACSKDVGVDDPKDMKVTIDPTITRATEVDFEQNDAIGLTITQTPANTKFADNVQFIYGADNKFAPQTDLKWYEDINAKSALFAYYPYNSAGTPTEFTVQADQSTAANYTASDLMTASKADVMPSASAVAMTFKHKLTKLVVAITNDTEFPVTDIVVKGAIGTATIDMATNTVVVKDGAAAMDVKAKSVTVGTNYTAIIVPQTVALKVEVTTAEGKRTQGLLEATLKDGGQYKITIRVMPKDMNVSISNDITGWNDEGDLPLDGETPEPDNSIEYGGVKYKTVVMKDGRTWLASNLCYIPSGVTPSADPTAEAGMWYPQDLTEEGGVYTPGPSQDPDYIKKVGYYYNTATALGGVSITEANYKTFESVRGICPEGWHIPSQAEVQALFDAYYSDASKASFYTELDKDGFNCTFVNMRQKNTSALTGAWSTSNKDGLFTAGYMMSSTGMSYVVNPDTQAITCKFRYLMYMRANQKLTIADSSIYAGIPVRCIKDQAK